MSLISPEKKKKKFESLELKPQKWKYAEIHMLHSMAQPAAKRQPCGGGGGGGGGCCHSTQVYEKETTPGHRLMISVMHPTSQKQAVRRVPATHPQNLSVGSSSAFLVGTARVSNSQHNS